MLIFEENIAHATTNCDTILRCAVPFGSTLTNLFTPPEIEFVENVCFDGNNECFTGCICNNAIVFKMLVLDNVCFVGNERCVGGIVGNDNMYTIGYGGESTEDYEKPKKICNGCPNGVQKHFDESCLCKSRGVVRNSNEKVEIYVIGQCGHQSRKTILSIENCGRRHDWKTNNSKCDKIVDEISSSCVCIQPIDGISKPCPTNEIQTYVALGGGSVY